MSWSFRFFFQEPTWHSLTLSFKARSFSAFWLFALPYLEAISILHSFPRERWLTFFSRSTTFLSLLFHLLGCFVLRWLSAIRIKIFDIWLLNFHAIKFYGSDRSNWVRRQYIFGSVELLADQNFLNQRSSTDRPASIFLCLNDFIFRMWKMWSCNWYLFMG